MVKIAEEVPAPEEYIKSMLDCIDENGNLNIARSISEDAFCTSDGEDYTHIESVKLDKCRAHFDELLDYYRNAIAAVENGTFTGALPVGEELGKYGERMSVYAKRIGMLIELGAPELIIKWEKCMFADSIVLYKTNAVGELIENKKESDIFGYRRGFEYSVVRKPLRRIYRYRRR